MHGKIWSEEMQVAAHCLAVLCILIAQFYVLAGQINGHGLKDLQDVFDVVKWQIVGQVAATLAAPRGFRFIATALASFTAVVLGIVLCVAWATVVYPVLTLIAWNNGHPSLFVGLVGLTIYVGLSGLAVLLVKGFDEAC